MIFQTGSKRLRSSHGVIWELRVDDLRALYDIDEVEKRVEILVIGRKVREKLIVAGKEVKL